MGGDVIIGYLLTFVKFCGKMGESYEVVDEEGRGTDGGGRKYGYLIGASALFLLFVTTISLFTFVFIVSSSSQEDRVTELLTSNPLIDG